MKKLIFTVNILKKIHSYLIKKIDDKFYPHFDKNWDDELFRKKILETTQENRNIKVLDIGAGAGIIKAMNFLDIFDHVSGLDPDNRVINNPFLHSGFIGLGDNMEMFNDNEFDMVISDNVFEHISHPESLFKEVSRVLKPEGLFLAKTPNKYHYMPLVAANTPTWFHKFYNKLRGREVEDTFPTEYLLNSKGQIQKIAELTNFELCDIDYHDGRQEYLRIFFPFYILGLIYGGFVERFNLKRLKILLIVKLINKKSRNFMNQIIQNLNSGQTKLEKVPFPTLKPGCILIKSTRSLISLGTEKMLVEFGQSNLISKARQQPDKVKSVFDKVKTDGLRPTIESVRNKLDQPLPLGYCNVGTVIEVGSGVTDINAGDRVVSNGPHAEIVCVPRNLVCLYRIQSMTKMLPSLLSQLLVYRV